VHDFAPAVLQAVDGSMERKRRRMNKNLSEDS
jgi:hypothetical protein